MQITDTHYNPVPVVAHSGASSRDGASNQALVGNGVTSGVPGSMLEPPRHLTADQGRIFSELVGMLSPYRIVEEPDRPMLAELAQLLDETRELTRDIRKTGFVETRETAMGIEVRRANPSIAIREKLASRAWAIIKAFGMTPAARRGIEQPTGGDTLDWLTEFGIE